MYWEATKPALLFLSGLVAAVLVPGLLSAGFIWPAGLAGLVAVFLFSAGYGDLLD